MQKLKEFISKPVGQIALVVVGFAIGFVVCKKTKKRGGYNGR
jgi:F0F1-type ATP synthase assembly protein I